MMELKENTVRLVTDTESSEPDRIELLLKGLLRELARSEESTQE